MIDASCQVCRRTSKRGLHISHAPGCTLMSTDAGCLEADLRRPCRYLAACHEPRRRQMVQAGLRGPACWAFEQHLERIGPDPDAAAERQAIREDGA